MFKDIRKGPGPNHGVLLILVLVAVVQVSGKYMVSKCLDSQGMCIYIYVDMYTYIHMFVHL